MVQVKTAVLPIVKGREMLQWRLAFQVNVMARIAFPMVYQL